MTNRMAAILELSNRKAGILGPLRATLADFDSRHSRRAGGRRHVWRRGGHPVSRLDTQASDQHVRGSVELMMLRACCPISGPAGKAKPAAPPAADGYSQGGGSRESQACRTETSSYQQGSLYPSPGLRLTVCSNPVRTAAVLTARLTSWAVSVLARVG